MFFDKRKRLRRPARVGSTMTLWGTGVTMAVCAVLCATLYVGLHISLHHEVDRFLEGEVQEFLTIITEQHGNLPVIERDIRRELGSRSRQDLSFRLLDGDGALLVTSDRQDALQNPWPAPLAPKRSDDRPRFETHAFGAGGNPIRVCSRWVQLPGGKPCIAQAVYSLRGVETSLARIRRWCIVAMVVAACLSLIGGRVLSRRILRPVKHMTAMARGIGVGNLEHRLNRTDNHDELDELAAVLNEMLERLERQFKQIQQFTADAAHELRTPLAALRGNAEVALSQGADEDDLRGVLAASIEEYDRLARIADDLLLLARAESGRPFLRPEPLELDTAVRDMVDLFAPVAHEQDVSLVFNNGTPVPVHADPARIRQVLSNLLDNALRHTPAGGRIDVDLSRGADTADLRVSDTGPGIPSEHLPHVFDRFYRVDAARSRRAGSAGLGLAICRTIVEAHGGRIDATSNGGGSVFTVQLPVKSTPTAG